MTDSRLHKERTIPNKTQSQALEGLIPGNQIIADRVDDQPQKLVFLQSQWTPQGPRLIIALHCSIRDIAPCTVIRHEDRALLSCMYMGHA